MFRELIIVGLASLFFSSLAVGASLPIHRNTTGFTMIPKFQEPIKCEKAQKEMSEQMGKIRNWFRPIMYGTADERLILSNIAEQVHDNLLRLGRHAIMVGREKYRRNRIQTDENNGDNLCYDYITSWRLEIDRALSVIIVEANNGNRALEGIGIESLLDESH